MTRSVQPVESFGPELMAALLKGAAEGLKVSMPYRQAVRFRQRIYQLRSAMQKEKHTQYNLVSRVRITISWQEGTPTIRVGNNNQMPRDKSTPTIVEIMPHDSEFSEALAAAGVNVDLDIGAVGVGIPDPEAEPVRKVESLEAFLADFKGDK